MVGMEPMLATLAETLPAGPGWAYECKWDGVRALVDIVDGRLRISSRAGNDITAGYPELIELAEGVADALVDGEIVVMDGGRPSFVRLQNRMHVRDVQQVRALAEQWPVSFIAFDLLRLFGVTLTDRPLSERRATLERLATDHLDWTVSPLFDDGAATEAAARLHGLEGVVAKRLASRYHPGGRTGDWVKMKFVQEGEFSVIGWEADAATPDRLSSLLLADADGFTGKVGSGLTARMAATLQRALTPRPDCPLVPVPGRSPGRSVTWVEPGVVVEVTYTERNPEGRLRAPVFRRVVQ